MGALVHAVTAVFDGMLAPFRGMNPLVGLSVVSVITGGVMLVIFRYTSNQAGIARAKDLIKAYVLEVRLFQDDLRLQMAAQRKILATNFRYMRYALAPMVVMLVPVLVILIQLDVRYARRPFRPGETTLVKASVEKGVDLSSVRLEAPDGIVVETEPMRIPDRSEVNWRVRVEREGSLPLTIAAGSDRAVKLLESGDRVVKLAEGRYRPSLLGDWEHPAERPLPKNGAIRSIEVAYPERDLRAWGFGMHWLVVFFVVSVAFGFAIKGFVGVEV